MLRQLGLQAGRKAKAASAQQQAKRKQQAQQAKAQQAEMSLEIGHTAAQAPGSQQGAADELQQQGAAAELEDDGQQEAAADAAGGAEEPIAKRQRLIAVSGAAAAAIAHPAVSAAAAKAAVPADLAAAAGAAPDGTSGVASAGAARVAAGAEAAATDAAFSQQQKRLFDIREQAEAGAAAPEPPLRTAEKKRVDFRGKTYLAPLTTVGNLPFRCRSAKRLLDMRMQRSSVEGIRGRRVLCCSTPWTTCSSGTTTDSIKWVRADSCTAWNWTLSKSDSFRSPLSATCPFKCTRAWCTYFIMH